MNPFALKIQLRPRSSKKNVETAPKNDEPKPRRKNSRKTYKLSTKRREQNRVSEAKRRAEIKSDPKKYEDFLKKDRLRKKESRKLRVLII